MRRYALTILLMLSGNVLTAEDNASSILDNTGVKGGLVVHLYCGDGQRTVALHTNDSFVVHGLDEDVTAARKHIQSLGLYGKVFDEITIKLDSRYYAGKEFKIKTNNNSPVNRPSMPSAHPGENSRRPCSGAWM